MEILHPEALAPQPLQDSDGRAMTATLNCRRGARVLAGLSGRWGPAGLGEGQGVGPGLGLDVALELGAGVGLGVEARLGVGVRLGLGDALGGGFGGGVQDAPGRTMTKKAPTTDP